MAGKTKKAVVAFFALSILITGGLYAMQKMEGRKEVHYSIMTWHDDDLGGSINSKVTDGYTLEECKRQVRTAAVRKTVREGMWLAKARLEEPVISVGRMMRRKRKGRLSPKSVMFLSKPRT